MVSSVLSFLAFAVAVVHGGTVTFASDTDRATISAACETPAAKATGMSPLSFDEVHGGVISVEFSDVKTDCLAYASGEPCVNHSAIYPPQFWCEFSGQLSPTHERKSVVYGPFSAYNKLFKKNGSLVTMVPTLDCETPMHDDIAYLSGYEGTPGEDEHGFLTLNVLYGPSNNTYEPKLPSGNGSMAAPHADASYIAWGGVASGNVIAFTGLYEPPSPASPPMPPAMPPPDCIETHNTLSWSYQYGSSSGCSYGGWHSFRWRAMGSKTWQQCAMLASNYGQMMVANTYISYGWHGHRKDSVAKAWLGSWSSFQTRTTSSALNCYLGRSTRTTTNNLELSSNSETSVDVDGYTWHYENIGNKYYDECSYYAETHGAMRITPYTVGKTTSSYSWWQQSNHMCNFYMWVNAQGTGHSYQSLGGGQRSTRVYCMVGYIMCDAS